MVAILNVRHLRISSKWDFCEYFLSKIQKRYLDCAILVTWPPLHTLLDLTMLILCDRRYVIS